MADQLQIDLVFVANPQDALAALADINDAAEGVSKTFTDAFDTSGLSRGLEDAAAAVDRISDADLSDLEAAAGALVDAAVPADAVAAALAEAAVAAEGIGVDATVDPAGADQLAAALGDAAAATSGVGEGLSESLTDAGADAGRLSDAMSGVTASAGDASVSVDDVAESLNAAADAAQETDTAISRVADAARELANNQPEEDDDPAQPQREVNEELEKSGKLAKILQDQFVQIVDTAHSVLPSTRGITTALIDAARNVASSGPLGLATIGIAAGAATLLTASTQYRTATDQIVKTTGATGVALDSLKDSFDGALRGSGKSMGDLAQILGQLNRDTGATGDELTKLTIKTASFIGITGGAVGDIRALNQAMRALGIGTEGMVGFQEKLVAAQKEFGGQIGSLLSQIKTAGPALTTLGFDPGQIAGLVAQFDQAGLSVQRLVPGFSKLAKEASQHGETATQAFGGLVERIKGAESATAALNEVQGIFSGRVATQFVTAVREGTISVDEINKAMASSPGIMGRLGAEMKGIVGQFSQIRNELSAQLGGIGEGVIEGIRKGVEDLRPAVTALIRALGAMSPAFIGFGQALLVPLAPLKLLAPLLERLADVLESIPDPLLAAVGAFAAFRLIPFDRFNGSIDTLRLRFMYAGDALKTGAESIRQGGTSLQNLGTTAASLAKGGMTAASSAVGALVSAISPMTLVIGAASIGLSLWSAHQQRAEEQARALEARVNALSQAFGTLDTSAAIASETITKLMLEGDKGGIVSDQQLRNISELGAGVKDLAAGAAAFVAGDREGIRKVTQQLVDLEKAKLDADIRSGKGVFGEGDKGFDNILFSTGKLRDSYAGTQDALKGLVKAGEEQALKQLDQLTLSGKVTVEMRAQAAADLHMKSELEGEGRVRDLIVTKLNAEAAARLGMLGLSELEAQAAGALINALEEAELTQDQLNAKKAEAADLERRLALVMNGADGTISLQDQVNAAVKAGVTDHKQLADATAKLQAAYEKVRGPTEQFKAAQTSILQGFDRGMTGPQAMDKAIAETGIGADKAADQVNGLTKALADLNDTGQPTAETTANIKRAWDDGVISGQEYAEVIELSGGNADVAKKRLQDYQTQVEASAKAIMNLAPDMASALEQLQAKPEEGKPDERLKSFDDEKEAIEAGATLRANDIEDRRRRAEEAKQLAQDRGFDTTGLDQVLAALDTETAQLNASTEERLGNVAAARDEMGQIVTDAAGKPLGLQAALKGMSTVMDTELTDAQTILQLHGEGLEDSLQFIMDPSSGLSAEQKKAFVRELATATPEQKAAMERQAEALDEVQKQILATAKAPGDIFAEQNTQFEDNARKRGAELATALAGGLAKGVVDARIADIINIATAVGAKPEDVIRQLQELGYLGGKALAEGRNSGIAAIEPPEVATGLEVFGVGDEELVAIETHMGTAGKASGEKWLGSVDDAIKDGVPPETVSIMMEQANAMMGPEGNKASTIYLTEADRTLVANPLPIETATAMAAPLNAQMGLEGEGGGFNWRGRLKGYIEENPLPSSTADAAIADVNGVEGGSTGLWAGGWAGGQLYHKGVSAGISSGSAFNDAFILGETVVQGGDAGMGNQSPSVKGMKSGALWVEGIALGIESSTDRAVNAAKAVGDAVAAAILPVPAGIDSAAIAAATAAFRPLVGAGSLVGAQTGGQFSSTSAVQGSQGEQAPIVHIENVTVTGTTNATADEVAEAMSRKIGWLGITGRHEL